MAFRVETEFNLFANPNLISASEVYWLFSNRRVMSLEITSEVRVYPLSILNLHENVNDTVGGLRFLPPVDHSVVP